MRAASYPATGYRPGSPRQRVTAIVLSAAIIIIALLLAIYMSGVVPTVTHRQAIVAFDAAPEGRDSSRAKAASHPKQPHLRPQPSNATMKRPRIVIPHKAPEQETLDSIPGFIRMSRDDLASADIGKIHGSAANGGDGQGAGKAAYGPGDGPGGVHLFNADWYREPTDAQLAGYLPHDRPSKGWGMIACQTVEHYRVDNCQILGEAPLGSGLGRAVLNAAWQFQVVPPRINSKPQLGVWVRIRIDYGERGVTAG